MQIPTKHKKGPVEVSNIGGLIGGGIGLFPDEVQVERYMDVPDNITPFDVVKVRKDGVLMATVNVDSGMGMRVATEMERRASASSSHNVRITDHVVY